MGDSGVRLAGKASGSTRAASEVCWPQGARQRARRRQRRGASGGRPSEPLGGCGSPTTRRSEMHAVPGGRHFSRPALQPAFARGLTDDRDGDVMGRVDGHRRGHGGRRRLPRLRPSAGGMGHAGGREGPLRSSSARLFVELSGERNRRCERRAASDRSSASTALSQSGDHRLTLALVMVTSPTPMVGRVSSPHVARLASETPAASA
jgi:hypothetical protein